MAVCPYTQLCLYLNLEAASVLGVQKEPQSFHPNTSSVCLVACVIFQGQREIIGRILSKTNLCTNLLKKTLAFSIHSSHLLEVALTTAVVKVMKNPF